MLLDQIQVNELAYRDFPIMNVIPASIVILGGIFNVPAKE